MAEQVKVKEHRWTEMSYQDVQVAGVDGEGIPVVIPVGDKHNGVSCLSCGAPYSTIEAMQICPGGSAMDEEEDPDQSS